MLIWLDDIRPLPKSYTHLAKSVNQAKALIQQAEAQGIPIQLISLDHDLGDFADDGGDGIRLLDWLVERGTFYPVKLHTANPAGRKYMQAMIDRFWR